MIRRDTAKRLCGAMLLNLAVIGGAVAGEEQQGDAAMLDQQTAEIADAWMEGKLDTIYLLNRQLNNFAIDIEVTGETVVLTGDVESEVDRELAEELAIGVEGIDEVTNRLEVTADESERAGRDATSSAFVEWVEDTTLAAEVKLELVAEGLTRGMSISVDVEDRDVTLSGHVDSDADRELAAEIAGNVEGVNAVDNQLAVKAA